MTSQPRSRLLSLALLTSLAATARASDEPPFPRTAAGVQAEAVALADLDLDGDDDLVFVHTAFDRLEVFASSGAGRLTLASQRQLASSFDEYPDRWLELADLTGDGVLDALVATSDAALWGTWCEVVPGDGALGFGAPVVTPAGSELRDLALADLDDDGDLDVATCFPLADLVGVAWNQGDGTLSTFDLVGTGLAVPDALAAGDLDGDGRADLVVAHQAGAGLRVLTSDGMGGLGLGALLPAAGAPDLAVADLDDDGAEDVVAVGAAAEVHPGLGAGAFGAPLSLGAGTPGSDPVVADLDGDGDLDLAWNRLDGLEWSLQLTPLTFLAQPTVTTGTAIPTGFNKTLAAGDVDRDGRADLAVVIDTYDVVLLESESDLAAGPGPLDLGGVLPYDVRLHDLDLDGDRDVVVLGQDTGGGGLVLQLLEGQAGGALGPAQVVSLGALSPQGTSTLMVADLTGDGLAELGLLDGTGPSLVLLPALGGLAFGAPVTVPLAQSGSQLLVDDLEGDGDPDVLVIGPGWIEARLGNGGGQLSAPVTTAWPGLQRVTAAGDVDGDGDLDLLGYEQWSLNLLLGDGSGGFGAGPVVLPDQEVHDSLLHDLDGDGDLDLVVSGLAAPHFGASFLWTREALGGAVFGPVVQQASKIFGRLRAADLDADGADEVVLAQSSFGGHLWVFDDWTAAGFGRRDGHLAIPAAGVPSLADLDGDGLADLVLATDQGLVQLTNQRDRWHDVGTGLAGAGGTPWLVGAGSLEPASPVSLSLGHAAPLAGLFLVVGLGELSLPFKGGVLVPSVDLLFSGFASDAEGAWQLDTVWPAGLPSGLSSWYQVWVTDAGGPAGLAATQGLEAVTP